MIASNAPDLFGCLLVVGVMAHIGIQVIINVPCLQYHSQYRYYPSIYPVTEAHDHLFLEAEMGMVLKMSRTR